MQENIIRKQENIIKRVDPTAKRSSLALKEALRKRVKFVFVNALELMEIKFGKNFDGYDELRAKILRVGNDAIRTIELTVDGYNVEKVPNTTVVFAQTGDEEGQGGQNEQE